MHVLSKSHDHFSHMYYQSRGSYYNTASNAFDYCYTGEEGWCLFGDYLCVGGSGVCRQKYINYIISHRGLPLKYYFLTQLTMAEKPRAVTESSVSKLSVALSLYDTTVLSVYWWRQIWVGILPNSANSSRSNRHLRGWDDGSISTSFNSTLI